MTVEEIAKADSYMAEKYCASRNNGKWERVPLPGLYECRYEDPTRKIYIVTAYCREDKCYIDVMEWLEGRIL